MNVFHILWCSAAMLNIINYVQLYWLRNALRIQRGIEYRKVSRILSVSDWRKAPVGDRRFCIQYREIRFIHVAQSALIDKERRRRKPDSDRVGPNWWLAAIVDDIKECSHDDGTRRIEWICSEVRKFNSLVMCEKYFWKVLNLCHKTYDLISQPYFTSMPAALLSWCVLGRLSSVVY